MPGILSLKNWVLAVQLKLVNSCIENMIRQYWTWWINACLCSSWLFTEHLLLAIVLLWALCLCVFPYKYTLCVHYLARSTISQRFTVMCEQYNNVRWLPRYKLIDNGWTKNWNADVWTKKKQLNADGWTRWKTEFWQSKWKLNAKLKTDYWTKLNENSQTESWLLEKSKIMLTVKMKTDC